MNRSFELHPTTDPTRHSARHSARRSERVSASYTGSAMLGTSMLMPRNRQHNRLLVDCLSRMPSSRVT